jgi:hypothetical protein
LHWVERFNIQRLENFFNQITVFAVFGKGTIKAVADSELKAGMKDYRIYSIDKQFYSNTLRRDSNIEIQIHSGTSCLPAT